MSRTRTFRRGVGILAAIGLGAATLTVLSGSASAAPGDATISASDVTDLNTTQVISVSGNAGPLSTDNNGSAAGGVPDTVYPALYISMCTLPLTASGCDTDTYINPTTTPVTGDPATDPHVRRVVPAANGDWGPVDFLVRKTLANGDGVFQCGDGTNGTVECVVGSANAPRPTDHSYDAITPILTFAPAAINITTPGPHSNGQTVEVVGSNFPMNTVLNTGTGSYDPTTKPISLFQCKLPVTGGGDCDSAALTPTTVSTTGSFTQNVVVSDTVEGMNCGVVTCGFGSIKSPPGAPDMWSVYGPGTLDFPTPPHAEAVALNNRGTQYAAAPQTGTATATRIGKSISIAGEGFAASTAFTAELCDADGSSNCSAANYPVPGAMLTSTATGAISTHANVAAGASVGVHTVRFTQGALVVVTPSFLIQGTPTIAAPATAVLGHSITVTGSMWDPGTSGSTPPSANPTVTVAAGTSSTTVSPDANGAFSVNLTVNDPAATQITATSGASGWLLTAAPSAFSYVALADSCIVVSPTPGNCQLFQDVNLQVTGGDLSMEKDPGIVLMSPITLNGTDQTSTGNVRQVDVTDARGSSAGWTLNASLNDLTTGGGVNPNTTLAASSFTWDPDCVTTSGGATVTAGTSTNLSNSDQVFCQTASGQGGGIFSANSPLSVPVPATQAAGLYVGILTLTLS